MKNFRDYSVWTLHHAWVIPASYAIGMIVLLLIHGSFGFTMNDEGTYLSNTLMHVGSGIVLALGTGILQKELVKKHFPVSFSWIWSLIIGFVLAELIAGIVLWKSEILRGQINIFNSTTHLPESLIFALAGLISGILQIRLLKPHYRRRFYWIIASALGWGSLILSTYLGPLALILGAFLYGAITGLVFYRLLESKPQNAFMV